MECEFCKNKLTTKSSLNYHKKSNKNCLDIQSKLNSIVVSVLIGCDFCKKKFSSSNMQTHLLTCKKKKKNLDEEQKSIIQKQQNEINELKETHQNEINELTVELKEKYQNEINELKEVIASLRAEVNIYKKDHETITSIAKQPKTTTNNTNYNLSVYDDNLIKDRFSLALNNIKPSDLYGGQKSIGHFVAPCLKNDDGTSMISCSDSSRNIFLYKDSDGNINKDVKCKNLANLIEPIATAKVDELIKVDNSKRYRLKRKENLRNDIIKRRDEIEKLEAHILGYRKDSDRWNQVNNQILRKICENERDGEEFENLGNDEIEVVENPYFVIDCDEKLACAADDIKEMKKDSCKFSKTISELV